MIFVVSKDYYETFTHYRYFIISTIPVRCSYCAAHMFAFSLAILTAM